MNAIELYKLKKKIGKIYKHMYNKEPVIFYINIFDDLFGSSIKPAIDDFLEESKTKNLDYKQEKWLDRILDKKKELYGF